MNNLPDEHVEEVKALDFPGRGDEGYMVPFSKVCYIEATDFREADAKDFYGLAPGKSIMLRCGLPRRDACISSGLTISFYAHEQGRRAVFRDSATWSFILCGGILPCGGVRPGMPKLNSCTAAQLHGGARPVCRKLTCPRLPARLHRHASHGDAKHAGSIASHSLVWGVRCRYAYAVHYKSHVTGADGKVTEVHVEYEPNLKGKPPKGVVNWVARPAPGAEPVRAEARLYADAVRRSSCRALSCSVPHRFTV